jgi:protein-histidine pros-kinase
MALNATLFLVVTRPVQRLSAIADEVSLGNMDAPKLQLPGNDEIAKLSQSFGRMRKSMAEALKMLETP